MIRLGPFQADRPIARGGMGVVWSGSHAATGLPVAIKVIAADQLDPASVASLRDEIRAVARLSHPHVIHVLDRGVVDKAAAVAADGKMPDGAEWFAMEHCADGTLATADVSSWARIRDVLVPLLGALGHAHARGVIHRDLKPGNVLFGGVRPGLKLTDFGMVFAVERALQGHQEPAEGGTPAFMAPEQFTADWRAQGPWTDLYALGCVAWTLACGDRPIAGKHWLELARRHQRGLTRPWRARCALPAGFRDWVGWLMQPEASDRPRCAADALVALEALGPPDVEPDRVAAPAGERLEQSQTRMSPSRPPSVNTTTRVLPVERGPVIAREAGGPAARRPAPPPFLPAWQGAIAERVPAVEGTGMSLFGLREVPLLDRDDERERLWTALGDVHRTGGVRALALVGDAGAGKSHLGGWLCERAAELGLATVFRARHHPDGGARYGLAGMLDQELRCVGLDRTETIARVGEAVGPRGTGDPDDPVRVADLIRPSGDPDAPAFSSAAERFALVARVLRALSADRPALLWLDDVQWGDETVDFVEWLAQRGPGLPALAVLAVRPGMSPGVQNRLDRVVDGRDGIQVGPLPPGYHRALVRALLPLEPALVADASARTAGQPLFAVQLVSGWVHAGLLEPGPRGYRLRSGAGLHADMDAVWGARLAQLVAGAPGRRDALERAAVLGMEVDRAEWGAACGLDDAGAAALLDALVDAGLAWKGRERSRFSFSHQTLRDRLVEDARLAGRLAGHHRACADALAVAVGPDARARLGLHRLESGDAAGAIDVLIAAAAAHVALGDYPRAHVLLDAAERALADRPGDPRLGRVLASRCNALGDQGRVEDEHVAAQRLLALAVAHGWAFYRVFARGLLQRSASSISAEDGLEHGRLALADAEALGDDELIGRSLTHLGYAELYRGQRAEAREHLERALAVFRADPGPGARRHAYMPALGLAQVAMDAGAWDEATALLEDLRHRATLDGSRSFVAQAEAALGEVARFRGDLAAAMDHYAVAWRGYEQIGAVWAWLARANLGLAALEAGREAEARSHLVAVLEVARLPLIRFAAHLGMLGCAAADADPAVFEASRAHVDEWSEGGRFDADCARICELAGTRALAAGHRDRAIAAWTLAVDQWQGAGLPERADALRQRLRQV